ncbi:sterol desaturase family protein [Glaciecola siphonariae]|uniref:Sterol desaturase family protein n=1 Tax=Glaciecola siphonariae TaxID=521012 RepID=A0ABV9LR62_9ALTE
MLADIVEFAGGSAGLWILATGYFGMTLLERIYHFAKGTKNYDNADALCSIAINLITSVIGLTISVLIPLALYVWVYEGFRIADISFLPLALVVAFVIHELAYYWEHRAAHRVGLMWAFHSVHHSSNSFNHSTAARAFYFDGQLKIIGALVAAFIGVPPVVYLAMIVFKNLYGIWNHASYVGHLGWLEDIFATPLNHKIHHANQPQYIDKNYSQVLIIWDRIFGTRAKYTQEPVPGLVNPVYNNNPITAQFVGFKGLKQKIDSASRWQDKIAYLYRPPDWTHCRSTKQYSYTDLAK